MAPASRTPQLPPPPQLTASQAAPEPPPPILPVDLKGDHSFTYQEIRYLVGFVSTRNAQVNARRLHGRVLVFQALVVLLNVQMDPDNRVNLDEADNQYLDPARQVHLPVPVRLLPTDVAWYTLATCSTQRDEAVHTVVGSDFHHTYESIYDYHSMNGWGCLSVHAQKLHMSHEDLETFNARYYRSMKDAIATRLCAHLTLINLAMRLIHAIVKQRHNAFDERHRAVLLHDDFDVWVMANESIPAGLACRLRNLYFEALDVYLSRDGDTHIARAY